MSELLTQLSEVGTLIDQIHASTPLSGNHHTFTGGEALMIATRAKGDFRLPRPSIFIIGSLNEAKPYLDHSYSHHTAKTSLFLSFRNPIYRVFYHFDTSGEQFPAEVSSGLEPGKKGVVINPKRPTKPIWLPNTYSVTADQYQQLQRLLRLHTR